MIGGVNVNNDYFFTMNTRQRAKMVNDLLKKESWDLQQIAEHFGINYSTFTKAMQEDDYVYIKRDNQYYKFVRDDKQIMQINIGESEEIAYLIQHVETLRSIIERHSNNENFVLDKRIFRSSSKISAKNFRISDDLYKEFVQTCDVHFPQYKIQDIIAQMILNFVDHHATKPQ